MRRAKSGSKVLQTIHALKDFSKRNPTVWSAWPESKWFKSYGLSKIKIMAQQLKMGVPHPNDIGINFLGT